MHTFLLRPLRSLSQCLTEADSPRHLALGVALGVLVGLVPKGNLLAPLLMTGVALVRVNLAAVACAALAVSWIGVWVDPLTHQLGMWLLHARPLAPLWTALYDLPVVPWTRFNNTVVLGSLALGLLLAAPAYWGTKPLFARYLPAVRERLRRLRIVQILTGAEWAGTLGET